MPRSSTPPIQRSRFAHVTCATFACAALMAAACDGGASAVDGMTGGGSMGPSAGAQTYDGMLPGTNNRYRLLRGRGPQAGQRISLTDLAGELGGADAVCLGELHDSREAHAAQLLLLDQLAQKAQAPRVLALGMEMVQFPFQEHLDAFAAGTIDELTMLSRVQWGMRWGFDFALYRPLVTRTLEARGPLRALNAPRELTRKVSTMGLESLTPEERAQLPELDLNNAAHKAWFIEAIGPSAPSEHGRIDRIYTVQVIWDETMAEHSWRWLSSQAGNPRQIAILAGTGHCMDLAIPARLRRRGAAKVVSVRPLAEDAVEVNDALAEGFSDYLVVYSP